jgi:hypothetical protein
VPLESRRTTYSRSSRFSHTSRRGRSDGAGNSEDTIIQIRSEQARAKAEAKAKAKAAEVEQNHIREVQEQRLLIKRKEMELDIEQKRKRKEVLVLEDEQLQARSESWMRNQHAIQEALIIEAGTEAEANAIIQETSLRSASPNLGLESLTTNEKNVVKRTTLTRWSFILVRLSLFAQSRH